MPTISCAWPTLDSQALGLRPIRTADLPLWLHYLQQPAVRALTSWQPDSEHDLAEFVWPNAQRPPSSQLRFAIVRRDDDQIIGSVGFHNLQLPHFNVELGYDLAPELWGQGIASLAVRALADWALGAAGLRRVQATVWTGNARSIAVLERCGLQREGLLRCYRLIQGQSQDFWMYARVSETPG